MTPFPTRRGTTAPALPRRAAGRDTPATRLAAPLRALVFDARLPLGAAAVLLVAATGAALVAPRLYPTSDEAMSVAIGRDVLAGIGPRTAFGTLSTVHSPAFPLLLVAPTRLLRIDPFAWGHLVSLASFVVLVGLAVLLARDAGRWGGVLVGATALAWLTPLDLARTARPEDLGAALALAYLVVGLAAAGAGPWSVRRPLAAGVAAIAAGILLGLAILVRESALPLAPVPFLAALALRAPTRRVLRAAGLATLAAGAACAPWFNAAGALTGRVYVLGLPAHALQPLAAVGALLAIGAIVVSLIPGELRARPHPGREPRGILDRGLPFAGYIAGAILGAWAVAMLVTLRGWELLPGTPLASFSSLRHYLAAWLPSLLPILVVGVGAIAALDPIMDGEPAGVLAATGLVASVPWTIVTIASGEPPRALIVPALLLVALAATGWVRLAHRWRDLSPRWRLLVGAVAGGALGLEAVAVVRQHAPHGGTALVLALLVGGVVAGLVAARALRLARTRGAALALVPLAAVALTLVGASAVSASAVSAIRHPDREAVARAAVSAAIASWLRGHVAAGSTVVMGSLQGHETAVLLGTRYRLRMLAPTVADMVASAPLGLKPADASVPNGDWLALDAHPRLNALYAFQASAVQSLLDTTRPAAVVYVTGLPESAPSIVGALRETTGLTDAVHRTWRIKGGALTLDIFTVAPVPLLVPTGRIFLDAPTLDRILGLIEGTDVGRIEAEELVPRLAFWPPAPDDVAAFARLRRIASAAR